MKFKIGDRVLAKSDPNKESHKIIGLIVNSEGVTYKVTSKEVDISNKKIIKGISFYKENELIIRPKVKKGKE